jgi:uncharacterized delta-60 repeat protein
MRHRSSVRAVAFLALMVVCVAAAPAVADPGDLDPTYGKVGVVRTRFPRGRVEALEALLQPDGSILVVGTQGFASDPPRIAAARYLKNGRLDHSWGGDGRAGMTAGGATDAALDPDGRLVVSFWKVTSGFGAKFGVARFDRDGSPDEDFGRDGRVTTALGDRDAISWAVDVLPSGKIVAAGQALSSNGNQLDLAVARYRYDGDLDPNFSGNGWVVTKAAAQRSIAFGVATQQDHAIVAAGIGLEAGTEEHALLARYLPDGTLDHDFGRQGVALKKIGSQSRIDDVEVTGSGRILVGGQTEAPSEGLLARFTRAGDLDETFGADGVVIEDAARIVWDVEPARYGKVAAGGAASIGGEPRAFVARYRDNGSPDTNFGDHGSVTDRLLKRSHEVRGIAVAPDTSIVVAVDASQFPGRSRMISARYIG